MTIVKNLCIANSQQYLCIAQLTIYSEAVPTADVGQQDGVAPTELEGLRYEVNVKNISMITNGHASFIPLTCSSQNIKWQSARTPVQVQPFSQPTGPQVSILNEVKDVFLFFTSSILKHIVRQSNMYAGEMMGERCAQWQLYTVEELCAYLGFMILMGIVRLPTLRDYWKKDEVFHYSTVAKRISRDRFLDLHRYLHFVDNSTLQPPRSPGFYKLDNVRPIINMIQ